MAKKRFISGDLTIDIKYNDRGYYVAKVCERGYGRGRSKCERVTVGVPKHIEHAVDSPSGYHDAAHAAISFSKMSDAAMPNPKGTGWSLRKPRRAKRRQKQRKAR